MSPIKGLTERRRLPRIGKIHLGIKVKPEGKAEYPKAVDYFVFDPNHPQYKELVDTYGEQPKELRVVFPLDDPEAFTSQFYRLYSRSRGLVCKGDGETATRMFDTKTGALANRDSKEVANRECTCLGRECPEYGRRGCGEVMNLQFLLPEVSGFGVWQIDTGSINSILNVNNALALVRQIYGRVSMVPLILALEPKEVINPDDGKKKTVRVLNIRSQDKMIEAFKKSRMAPLALVQGMGEVYEEGDKLELPETGDTAPFIDLPSETEQPRIGSTEYAAKPPTPEQIAQAEKNTKDLWPPDPRYAAEAAVKPEPQPAPEPTSNGEVDKTITMIAQADSLPVGKPGMRLQVIETNEVLEWVQVDDKSGRWHNLGVNPQPARRQHEPEAVDDEPTPATLADFFVWLQSKDKKFGPTWFYKTFSYTKEAMKEAKTIGEAYREVKEIQGW